MVKRLVLGFPTDDATEVDVLTGEVHPKLNSFNAIQNGKLFEVDSPLTWFPPFMTFI
jgi:hypothetical protein